MIQKRDVNVACRITWDTWVQLDRLRASRTDAGQKTSLSDVIREALETYVGDTWKKTDNN